MGQRKKSEINVLTSMQNLDIGWFKFSNWIQKCHFQEQLPDMFIFCASNTAIKHIQIWKLISKTVLRRNSYRVLILGVWWLLIETLLNVKVGSWIYELKIFDEGLFGLTLRNLYVICIFFCKWKIHLTLNIFKLVIFLITVPNS